MNQLTSKDSKGIPRVYNGTIIRDIVVDIRILYNTNQVIFDNFNQFLGYLKLKFISSYDCGTFPDSKESGQAFWGNIKYEYFGLRDLGFTNNIQSFQIPKTIENFA
jgi:hypothetical protein